MAAGVGELFPVRGIEVWEKILPVVEENLLKGRGEGEKRKKTNKKKIHVGRKWNLSLKIGRSPKSFLPEKRLSQFTYIRRDGSNCSSAEKAKMCS